MIPGSIRSLVGPVLAVLVVACSPIRENDAVPAAAGEACSKDAHCGAGLVCAAGGVCSPVGEPGTADAGEACADDDGCRFGLLCNGAGRCARTRGGQAGSVCSGDSGCTTPLVCGHGGRCVSDGEPGTAAQDEACSLPDECRFGLTCTGENVCGPIPRWAGVACGEARDGGPPRIHFEIPRGRRTADFFRLPYPNDALARSGVVDLEGFPGLENAPEPAELVGRYVSAVDEARGFGLNPAVIFRFSTNLDYSTLRFGGDRPTFAFVDITPGDEGLGRRPRSRFFATTDRARYICHNWLGIRPSEGSPLEPGHTYAVYFTRGIRDDRGELLDADTDFAALLTDTPPQHPALQQAWDAYAPFRNWLAAEGIPPGDVIGGTVFTTGDPRGVQTARIREAVHAAPVPTVGELTICDGGTDSPCEGGGTRTCGDLNEFFVEVHGRATLPNYLRGVPPYTDWGGDFENHRGQPRLQRQEPVCVAVTVPRGPMPPGGWPVVLYAHDAGGDFRSFVTNGLAARLARLGWAMISVDGVLHGDRFGVGAAPSVDEVLAVLEDPSRPGPYRDLALQAVADLYSMVRLLPDARVPTDGGTARFNAQNVVFFGHGRGGQAGALFLPYEPDVRAAVLAAAGGGMVDLLRLTRSPVSVAAELELALADAELNGMHPALHLMQTWLDPRDPMNFASLLRRPPEGVPGKHLFFIYGVDDPVTPPVTMNHLAAAMRLEQAGTPIDTLDAVPIVPGAVSGNARINGQDFTHVLKQYAPGPGESGHDVAFENRGAIGDLNRFFSDLLEPGAPTFE